MGKVRLEIDISKLKHNARTVVDMCRPLGIRVSAVTKSCCGHPEVARTLLAGGVFGLADSRIENISRLRRAGIEGEVMLLRSPTRHEISETVDLSDISLNTEISTIALLGREAVKRGKNHGVIIMVDVGDLREGLLPQCLDEVVKQAARIEGIRLVGVGTNHACFGGVIPTKDNLGIVRSASSRAQALLGHKLDRISGGNSSALHLIKKGIWDEDINHLRVGESIMLGRDITDDSVLTGLHQDVFSLTAEVIEVQRKPSVPMGQVGRDAFGNVPIFEDRGVRRRALLAIGKQDIGAGHLKPPKDVPILGATSDHLVVDIEDSPHLSVGSEISFIPDYGALVGLMTSSYVTREFKS